MGRGDERLPKLQSVPVADPPDLEGGLALLVGAGQGSQRPLHGAVVGGAQRLAELSDR